MAEQWIEASTALEIAGNRYALCTRLHSGLAVGRAAKFQVGDESHVDMLVPAEFWWAEGHEALEQNWDSGDFSTWIEKKHQCLAFGVRFALSGLLEMIEFEQRPLVSRRLSVATNPDWVSAQEARRIAYERYGKPPSDAGRIIIEHARLGFIAGRAVLFQDGTPATSTWEFEEREWDIQPWFWNEFTANERSQQDWTTGKFTGKGRAPGGVAYVHLSGVHFHRESLEAALSGETHSPQTDSPIKRGRPPEYDWLVASTAIWGQIFRGELIPKKQADVERAFLVLLTRGDKEPSESTVRPHAARVWEEYSKEA